MQANAGRVPTPPPCGALVSCAPCVEAGSSRVGSELIDCTSADVQAVLHPIESGNAQQTRPNGPALEQNPLWSGAAGADCRAQRPPSDKREAFRTACQSRQAELKVPSSANDQHHCVKEWAGYA